MLQPNRSLPIPFELPTTGTNPRSELNAANLHLPLVLRCITCLRTSTWFSPAVEPYERSSSADFLPSLSISSCSSSEPSSIDTDFLPETILSTSNEPSNSHRSPINLKQQFLTSEDKPSVAGVPKWPVPEADCPKSLRIQGWIMGELHGVCSSCKLSNDSDSTSDSHQQGASVTPVPSASNLEGLPGSDTVSSISSLIQSLNSGPQPQNVFSSRHLTNASMKAHRLTISLPQPMEDLSASLDKPHPTHTKLSSPTKPGAPNFYSEDDTSVEVRPQLAQNPRARQEPTTISSDSVFLESNVLPQAPPISLSLSADASKAKPSTHSPRHRSDLADIDRSQRDPSSDSTDSSRQDPTSKAASLRLLLREAKIPHSDSDESLNSNRRLFTAGDMWQAAMIATPRDHIRNGDFPKWQAYGNDSPFYQHLCELSASSISLSGKEILQSTSIPSFRNPSPCTGSRSCSPPSARPTNFQVTASKNSPILGRPATATCAGPPTLQFSSTASGGSFVPESLSESQEVLTGSVIAKSPRPSPSNISLMSRFANLHQNASKLGKGSKRRPNTATGSTEPSLAIKASPKPGAPGKKAPVVTFSYKRPATATCSNTMNESHSLSGDCSVFGHPMPIKAPKTANSFAPTLPAIPGRAGSEAFDRPAESPKKDFQYHEFNTNPVQTTANSFTPLPQMSQLSSPQSVPHCNSDSAQVSQSHSDSPPKPRISSKRNAFYSSKPLAVTSEQLCEVKERHSTNTAFRTPPEEFHSKSRNFILSISPRPSSTKFNPGQRISAYVKLSNKVKARKYTSIYLMIIGSATSEGDSQSSGSHDFLRHNYMIHPNPSEEVRVTSSGDSCEWHIELDLPQYANCGCQPGPLPLPSTGTYASREVSYSFQLHADRKQLFPNPESLSVKMNIVANAEVRYQVTTKLNKTLSRKGRIPFAGGYLGGVDELSLSHQVYYQSVDRLRVGYQFALQLSSNSFLPSSIAEAVSQATKIEINNLAHDQSRENALKFTDHRSNVVVVSSDEKGGPTQWIVKGFLELRAVSQQMKAIKAFVENSPRTPRRVETSAGSRSLMSSQTSTTTAISTISSSSSTNHSLLQETERITKFNSSQLFLIASVEHCPSVFAQPVELSSLIGPELLSPCSLRKIGDDMMKRAIMAEKMKKVQEENFKNDQ